MNKSVIIIGAGPSGLTAGLELIKKGYEVTILEETDSIGGISKTIHLNQQRIDIGGHRFFSKDERIMNWWKEILPVQGALSYDDKLLRRNGRIEQNGPDPEVSDEVFLIRHRVSRIYYNHNFFEYPINFSFQTFKNLGLGTSCKAGFSYLASCMRKLPEDSLENFYINRFGRKLYSMFFEGYTTKVWGRTPAEISADWGSQRVKGVSIALLLKKLFNNLLSKNKKEVETSLIEEFYYPKYGPGQMWETVAKRFEQAGGKLFLGKKVTGFLCDKFTINSLTCSDGSEFETEYVFSSMPIQDLIPSLKNAPEEIISIAQGLPYRDFVTIGLLVDKLSISNKTKIRTLGDIVPDCWIYVQDSSVKMGRIQIFNNWSPYMLKDPVHTIWIGLEYFCQENDDFWNLGEKESIDFAMNELAKIGVIDKNARLLDSCRARVKKAYPAYFDSYNNIEQIIEYLNQYENLYCIGRNGQHRYNNMDHSMATAFTAIEVMEDRAKIEDLWKVNTEREYHEERNT